MVGHSSSAEFFPDPAANARFMQSRRILAQLAELVAQILGQLKDGLVLTHTKRWVLAAAYLKSCDEVQYPHTGGQNPQGKNREIELEEREAPLVVL